ncbi:phenylalanyl-tRNA synthetase subunit beta [compost metagenome]
MVDAAKLALREVELETAVATVDIYQPEVGETKNITLRIRLAASDRTLTSEEVSVIISKLTDEVVTATSATVV